MQRKLPLDISTFRKLRESHYIYVDKTNYAYDLIMGGRRFFLSRPRRFGKSLFVSTLREILNGNQELFNDLWIAQSDYQWQKYGVITLDLSGLGIKSLETLESGIRNALIDNAQDYNLEIDSSSVQPEIVLRNVVRALYARYGRVAILIDEYDNPLLHALKDQNRAREMCDGLRRFFTAIKGLDEYIDFVFITGVSAFAKAGLFSGMNNLRTITFEQKYSGICGYSDQEVDAYFAEYITAWAQKDSLSYETLRKEIKLWYNGYHFGQNGTSIYNPFSIMYAFDMQKFKNFWFQSGTPTFLVEILKKEYLFFDPEQLEVTEDSLGTFEVGTTPLIALMFQAGYLTIVDYDTELQLYRLDYPNYEVKVSFQKYLLEAFAHMDARSAQQIPLQLL